MKRLAFFLLLGIFCVGISAHAKTDMPAPKPGIKADLKTNPKPGSDSALPAPKGAGN